ncbi:FixH family protein, partial [Achromobacter xylosoxidans]|uniref:FixH family protein n=2 Tax=Alcaligenes xylosoxydans xylosoxydans TaxID=85698 RepID=UPI001F142214
YREFWPWFLMAGPFLAVIGCIVTMYLAFTRFGNQSIQEGVVQRGLMIEQAETASSPSEQLVPEKGSGG